MAISFKGAHFPQEIILMGVRWYVAYPLRRFLKKNVLIQPDFTTSVA